MGQEILLEDACKWSRGSSGPSLVAMRAQGGQHVLPTVNAWRRLVGGEGRSMELGLLYMLEIVSSTLPT